MNDNGNPVVFSTEKTAGGHTSVGVHESYENPYFLLRNPTEPAIGDIDTKVVNSGWRITRWKTAFRVVTLLSSLAAVGLTFFGKQLAAILVFDHDGSKSLSHVGINCKDSGSVMFFMYVNLAVCGYSVLLLVSTFVMGRKGVAEKTPTSMRWSAFVLHIVAIELLLIAFVASWIIEVLNNNGTKIFVNDDDGFGWDVLCPECSAVGHGKKIFLTYPDAEQTLSSWCPRCSFVGWFNNCSIQNSDFSLTMGVSVLAYASLLAGTCLDAYCLIKRTRRT